MMVTVTATGEIIDMDLIIGMMWFQTMIMITTLMPVNDAGSSIVMSPPEREAAARSCTSSFLSDSMLTTSCCTASPCCVVSRKQCLNQKYWANTKPAARAAQGSIWEDVLRVSMTCTTSTHAVGSHNCLVMACTQRDKAISH